jgi:hypothetical protein
MIYTIDTVATTTGERIISFYRGNDDPIPYGITIDSDNKLYQTDTYNSKIYIFKPSTSPLGSMSGIIIDQSSLQPVKNVIVKLKKQNSYLSKDSYKVQTDENGSFVIHDLVEGTYLLTVEADRYPVYNSNIIEIKNNTTFDAGSIAIGPKRPLLTISKAGTGNGTVTSLDGNINCGSTCSKVYDVGTSSVTLTASEDPDSTFTGWSGCPSAMGNQCIATINADINVTATFTIKPCTYSLSPSNVILPSTAGSGSLDVIVHSTGGGICNWQAQSNASWITISSGASSTGSSLINYSVSANTGTSSRIGYITVEGKTTIVRQLPDVDKQLDHWYQRNSNWFYGVTYGNGVFVAVGRSGILTSLDGLTWNTAAVPVSNTFFGVTCGNGVFIAVGSGGTVVSSVNGITWANRSPGTTTQDIKGVAYGNGYFVAVGLSGTILRSSDGMTWTATTSGTSDFYSITYGNGYFMISGSGGTKTSSNGSYWSSVSSLGFSAITYGNGLYVAGNSNGSLYKSTSGTSWTFTLGSQGGIQGMVQGITYGNGIFIVVTSSGGIYTSTDGTIWKRRTLNNAGWFNGVAFGDNSFIVVGSSMIIQSDNGLYPIISATPANYDFGSQYSLQTFILTNNGSTNLTIGNITTAGPNTSDFIKTDDFCTGKTVEPAGTCILKMAFSPQSAGVKNATLNIPSNDPNTATLNITLSGLAVLKGDINNDGSVNMQDAILVLQLLSGFNPLGVRTDYAASATDIDGNDKIGLPEVICIFQKISGIRSAW